MGDHPHAWRSFPCVGGRLDAEVVVGVGGVVVAHGVTVLWFSWSDSGRVGGAYCVEEQRRTTNFHSTNDEFPFVVCHSVATSVLRVLRLHAEIIVVVWSMCWWVWCLAMDGEGRRWRAMRMDDGGYVEGCGFRIWTEFPLMEFAEILSRKAVKFCIYSINYVGILKPLWYTCLSTHDYYCECNLKVEGSIPVGAHFFTLYSNNNSDKLLVLLDSYWTPVYPFLRNLQFLIIPVGIY